MKERQLKGYKNDRTCSYSWLSEVTLIPMVGANLSHFKTSMLEASHSKEWQSI